MRVGRVEPVGRLAVSYSTSAAQLKDFCKKHRLVQLTMHCGHRGRATAALECGIPKTKIKLCGGLSSNAVEDYLHPIEPGMDFSRRVLQ